MKVPHLFARFNLALLVLMMAGCAGLPSQQSVALPVPAVQSVLEQFRTVQKISPGKINAKVPALELAYAQVPNTVNRLRLAVMLGFGQCQKCDSGRALKLFKETLESSSENSVVALASLSIELLELKAMIADKNSALLNQQQQVIQLQQKLDGLTSIEESLHLRK